MDAIIMEFEEINSTIDIYLNNIESGNDEELAPRKTKCTTKISNHQPPNLRESHLPSNQMVSTTQVQLRELEHSKTQSISFLRVISQTKNNSFPTATPCRKLKE